MIYVSEVLSVVVGKEWLYRIYSYH